MFIFILTLGILRAADSQYGVPQADEGCTDDYSYCHAMKAFCASDLKTQSHCKKTCEMCPEVNHSPQSSKICKDNYRICPERRRFCRTSSKVREACPHTCGVCSQQIDCKDTVSYCPQLRWDCRTDSRVRRMCPKTCEVCELEEKKLKIDEKEGNYMETVLEEDCKDKDDICDKLGSLCTIHEATRDTCPKTCGLCGKAKPRTPPPREPAVRPEPPKEPPARPAEPKNKIEDDCSDKHEGDVCFNNKDLCRKQGSTADRFRLSCQKTCGLCGQVLTTTPAPSVYAKPNGRMSVGGASCQCGLPNDKMTGQKIVGGTEVKPHLYPWQVGLKMKNSRTASCGGTLINEKWVLSAAHCYMKTSNDPYNYSCWMVDNEYIATIGEHDQRSDADNAPYFEKIPVKRHVEHPKFDCFSFSNDFALLELEKPVKFGDYEGIKLLPICLPADDSKSYSGEHAIVSGWGTTTEAGRISEKLQEVKLDVADENCDGYTEVQITPDKLCAGGSTRDKDACQGDSGGPLFLTDWQGYIQIGVVSSGIGCARDGKPGIYARVSKTLDWINSVTNSNEGYCMKN